jgi:hypothetical protein
MLDTNGAFQTYQLNGGEREALDQRSKPKLT